MNDEEPTGTGSVPALRNPFFDTPPSADGAAPDHAPIAPMRASTHVNARSASLGLPELTAVVDAVTEPVATPEPVAVSVAEPVTQPVVDAEPPEKERAPRRSTPFPVDAVRRLRVSRPWLLGAAAVIGFATLGGGAAIALQPVGTAPAGTDEANHADLTPDGSPRDSHEDASDETVSVDPPSDDPATSAGSGGDASGSNGGKRQRTKDGTSAGSQPSTPKTGGGSTSPTPHPTSPAGPTPTPGPSPSTPPEPTPEPEPEPSVEPEPEPPHPTEPTPE